MVFTDAVSKLHRVEHAPEDVELELQDLERAFLFGADAADIGSVALMPLGDKGTVGLLALGSPDRDRFHPGMSTEFLARVADLIADTLTAR